MALINCPECNREMSSLVEVCPHCGYPYARELQKMNVGNGQAVPTPAQPAIKPEMQNSWQEMPASGNGWNMAPIQAIVRQGEEPVQSQQYMASGGGMQKPVDGMQLLWLIIAIVDILYYPIYFFAMEIESLWLVALSGAIIALFVLSAALSNKIASRIFAVFATLAAAVPVFFEIIDFVDVYSYYIEIGFVESSLEIVRWEIAIGLDIVLFILSIYLIVNRRVKYLVNICILILSLLVLLQMLCFFIIGAIVMGIIATLAATFLIIASVMGLAHKK